MKRLILIVLSILISVPVFELATWQDNYLAPTSGLKTLYNQCDTDCDPSKN